MDLFPLCNQGFLMIKRSKPPLDNGENLGYRNQVCTCLRALQNLSHIRDKKYTTCTAWPCVIHILDMFTLEGGKLRIFEAT